MNVYEALKEAAEDEQGLRAAITYPGRAYIAIDFGGEPQPILIICIADEDSKGKSIPGGSYILLEGSKEYEYIAGLQWRPAVRQGKEHIE